MSDEQKPSPLSLVPPPAPETKASKAKKHVGKHKKKYGAASVVALLIALLEAYPTVCPILPAALGLKCEAAKPLAQFGATKLQELQDAGF